MTSSRSRREVALLATAAIALAGCSVASPAPLPSRGTTEPLQSVTAEPAPLVSPSTQDTPSPTPLPTFAIETFPVPPGSRPHDVAPAADGGVWYTAQATGELGWLDPATGEVREVALGPGSAPHGVIVGPDGVPWITDGGLNAIVRVFPDTLRVEAVSLPAGAGDANLNTATFDADGLLWFTGQNGVYGSLDPARGEMRVYEAPGGRGPYGITATDAAVYYASLAGSYLGAVDPATGAVTVLDPPTAGAGVRRAWSDSRGRVWISEWEVGQLGRYDPATGAWLEWELPGAAPMAYAVYVDETDAVWLSDFGGNALVRFDPETETFRSFPHASRPAEVRQLHGRAGEVWGAESAADRLVVVRFGTEGGQ